ncbi:MAG TPA: hypothetical protein VGU64_11785 [Terriglobales bacterium]|nr:hypothetical protein [Terriglobales bacterium]
MKTCPDCNGDGVIEKGTDDEQQCPTCGGSGFVPDDDDDDEVTRTASWRPDPAKRTADVRFGQEQTSSTQAPTSALAITADVHHMREAAMRLAVYLTICLMPMLANAAQKDAQAPSDPKAYCVNRNADFYPYTGEPCKSGYQLGSGNCRKTDGRMVAVPR